MKRYRRTVRKGVFEELVFDLPIALITASFFLVRDSIRVVHILSKRKYRCEKCGKRVFNTIKVAHTILLMKRGKFSYVIGDYCKRCSRRVNQEVKIV